MKKNYLKSFKYRKYVDSLTTALLEFDIIYSLKIDDESKEEKIKHSISNMIKELNHIYKYFD